MNFFPSCFRARAAESDKELMAELMADAEMDVLERASTSIILSGALQEWRKIPIIAPRRLHLLLFAWTIRAIKKIAFYEIRA